MATIRPAAASEYGALLTIWESSVRATHHFLSEKDILQLRPQVDQAFNQVDILLVLADDKGRPVAFVGLTRPEQKIDAARIEMLFVEAASRGQGYGRALINHLAGQYHKLELEVNEENPSGRAFYEKLGFVTCARLDCDLAGRPFPLIQMRLELPPKTKS